ncbi:hypothetical protein ABMA59_31235 [Mesorhizobium sp. CN2-181]
MLPSQPRQLVAHQDQAGIVILQDVLDGFDGRVADTQPLVLRFRRAGPLFLRDRLVIVALLLVLGDEAPVDLVDGFERLVYCQRLLATWLSDKRNPQPRRLVPGWIVALYAQANRVGDG